MAAFDPTKFKDLRSLMRAVRTPADGVAFQQALDQGKIHLKFPTAHVMATRDDVAACAATEIRHAGVDLPQELREGRREVSFMRNKDGSTSVTLSDAAHRSSVRMTSFPDGSEDISIARADGTFQKRHIDGTGAARDPQATTPDGLNYRTVDTGTPTSPMPNAPQDVAGKTGERCFGQAKPNPRIGKGPQV